MHYNLPQVTGYAKNQVERAMKSKILNVKQLNNYKDYE